MPRNLILAYGVTWLIHTVYLSLLFAKKRRLDRQKQD